MIMYHARPTYLTSNGTRRRVLFNTPWQFFRKAIDARLPFDQFLDTRLPGGGGWVCMEPSLEQRVMFLSRLALGPNEASPSDQQTPAHELAVVLEQTVLGCPLSEGGHLILSQLLQLPGRSFVSAAAELAFGLISNNMVPKEGIGHVLGFIIQQIPRDILNSLLSIDSITIDVAVYRLLETAILAGDEATVEVLLDAGTNGERVKGPGGTRLLHKAIEARRTKMAQRLLDLGVSPNPAQIFNIWPLEYETPLHAAVGKENAEVVRSLLEAGADVSRADEYTALALAIAKDSPACASMLLHAGADVDNIWVPDKFADNTGHSRRPLDNAFLGGKTEMHQLLSAHSKNDQRSLSLSGILVAARTGSRALEAYLGDQEPALDDSTQKTALEEALAAACCYPGHEAAISVLVDSGADPNAPLPLLRSKGTGPSPLERAIQRV